MAFADLIDIEFIDGFLGIDDRYDDLIEAAIPFYLIKLKKLINISDYDTLTEEQQTYMLGLIAVAIGCHIMKTNPSFGLKYQNWTVGNTSKSYFRRYASDFENWCDLYEDLLNTAEDTISDISTAKFAQRPGIADMFTIP